MNDTLLDLKREQQATLARPRFPYSAAARFFFWSMDVFAGRKITLSKTKLLEMLASIPYRQWEILHYARLTRRYHDTPWVQQASQIVAWGREAQDNEYWHLLVIQEKMKAEGLKDAWYLTPPIPWLMVWTYVVLARLLALFSQRRAFLFNGEFEDHAEHSYAQFVEEHPEWETQPVNHPLIAEHTDAATWADVFRRIALDERDHRNRSFVYAGKPEHVVAYSGMPE
ncbi:MAG TPA: alternative oxidase [Anaerolineae bacterium]|nr:alternative oxidase [Anaerolineae bacterium]HQI85089.1 alternative oxidase [Anaerolineae bacterium]